MDALVYREDSLARVINDELRTFVESFGHPSSNIIALLTFPMNLGIVITKCIRYHAVMYNLVEFYVTMAGKAFMVVCQYHHLKLQYQQYYNSKWQNSYEDSELIDPYHLYAYINKSIASLTTESKRRSFGLNLKYDAITNKDEADEKSSVTNKDAEAGTSSVADRDAEDGESSVANTDAGAGTSSVGDTDEDDQNSLVADNNEEDENSSIDYFNCFPTVFTSNMSNDASQISKEESKVFLQMIEQHQKTNRASRLHPLQKQTLPANRPMIYKFSEEPQPEDHDNMGDSLTSNPTDNASSVVQKLNVLALETVPEDTLTDDIGEYGQQFFEFKYFMDQVLDYVWDVPRFVKTRCDLEAYKFISETILHSVVEVYDIPGHYRTHHILNAFKFGARCVKWCDDTHALLIFTEKEHADKALLMEHPLVQVRAMINASPISTVIACMMNFPAVFQHLRNK